jgi:hypothetical protein
MEERAFAIIRLSGTQYKVTIDDVIVCDILGGHEVGDTIEVSEVLLFGTQNEVSSSRPWGGWNQWISPWARLPVQIWRHFALHFLNWTFTKIGAPFTLTTDARGSTDDRGRGGIPGGGRTHAGWKISDLQETPPQEF